MSLHYWQIHGNGVTENLVEYSRESLAGPEETCPTCKGTGALQEVVYANPDGSGVEVQAYQCASCLGAGTWSAYVAKRLAD